MGIQQTSASSTQTHCCRLHASLGKLIAQMISAVKAAPKLCLLTASKSPVVSLTHYCLHRLGTGSGPTETGYLVAQLMSSCGITEKQLWHDSEATKHVAWQNFMQHGCLLNRTMQLGYALSGLM